jgi:hypothetical protein
MTDKPQAPGPRRGIPVWVFVVSLLAVAAIAGSLAWLLLNPVAPAETVTRPTPTVTVEATPAVTAKPAQEPTVAPPAAKADLPYTPGPDETGTNFAYVKSMVVRDGYVYATVDCILIGEGPDGWTITNDNPKLRTFPLAKTCPCRYLREGTASLSTALSPTAFRTKWASAATDLMIRANPYKVTVKHGVVTKLDNEWLP